MTENKERDTAGSDWFWSIIAAAQVDRDRLRNELMKLDRDELVRFQEEFLDLAGELTYPAFLPFVEESEDGLSDITQWVVSQGREQYQAVLADPASIPHSVEGKEREILTGVAPALYEERYGELMDVY